MLKILRVRVVVIYSKEVMIVSMFHYLLKRLDNIINADVHVYWIDLLSRIFLSSYIEHTGLPVLPDV